MEWSLGLERSTSNYIVLEEVKRDKLRILTGTRAMSYDLEMDEREVDSKGMSKGKRRRKNENKK